MPRRRAARQQERSATQDAKQEQMAPRKYSLAKAHGLAEIWNSGRLVNRQTAAFRAVWIPARRECACPSATRPRCLQIQRGLGTVRRARLLWAPHQLPAGVDHRSLQRTLPVLHAAGASGMAAASRNPELRGNGPDRPRRRFAGRHQAAGHGRRTADPPRRARVFPAAPGHPGHP